MKQLPKNCYCSDFSVYPNNWSKSGASIKKDWYIQYYTISAYNIVQYVYKFLFY